MKEKTIMMTIALCMAFFGSFVFYGFNLEALRHGLLASLWTGYGIFASFLCHKKEPL